MRVVVKAGALVPDPERRLPGRGAHLHRDLACLELADRRRAFSRALRVPGPLDLSAVREVVAREQVKLVVRERLTGPSLVDELLADRRRAAAADDGVDELG